MDSQDHLINQDHGLTTCYPWSKHHGVHKTGRIREGFKISLNTTVHCLSEEFKAWKKINVAYTVGITDWSLNLFPFLLLFSHGMTLGAF